MGEQADRLTALRRKFDDLMADWQDVEWQQSKRWEELMALRREIIVLETRATPESAVTGPEDTDGERHVWAVTTTDYEHHRIEGMFSSEAAALEYKAIYEDFQDDSNSVVVEVYAVDLPRRRLPGAWWVYADADGNEVEREKSTNFFLLADAPPQRLEGDWDNGAVARGFGLTPEEALAAARTILATPESAVEDACERG
jgi:hypothetical protein